MDTNEYVTISDLSKKLNIDKSNTRKYVLKQGFSFSKIRTPETRGQLTLVLSAGDAESIIESRKLQGFNIGDTPGCTVDNGIGYFYVIQLIPEAIPQRVKLGFATNIKNRLNAHRTTAPTATIIKSWPSEKAWERAAIASVTRVDCDIVGGEVFDCIALGELISRSDAFFDIMPGIKGYEI